MIKIDHKSQCSGCGACADVCPAHCIDYRYDSAGFIYPIVDVNTCIGCGACDRVCPIKPENISTQAPLNCYAAWAKDKSIHQASASGGLGHLLAKTILDRDGVVYGCSAESPRHIRHIRIDNKADLQLLRGSKYVQSDTCGIYRLLKNDIQSGRDVLFVGTPCQVSAVKNLFKKTPENLYIIDLICHGVPSQKMLNEQIDSIGKKNRLGIPTEISFRDGTEFRLQLTYPGNTKFCETVWRVPYYRVFIECLSFRPSCYKCPYASSKRPGDITIGDFWEIKNPQKLPIQAGVSVALTSTPKGAALMESIHSELNIIRRPIAEAIAGNQQLQHPAEYSFRAKLFGALYPHLSISIVEKLCVADKKLMTLLHIIARKRKNDNN